MTTSNTYAFASEFSNADMLLDAFDRVQVRPEAITNEHMVSARRSMNLILSRWANRGVNLWKVELETVPLTQGTALYGAPNNTVKMLDAYLRTYQLPTAANPTAFTTTLGSPTVTVTQADHGLIPGMWISVVTQVAVGGIVVYGYYPVITVPTPNTFTITADNALSADTPGSVPLFTSTAGDSTITVGLVNHGMEPNETFTVGVATTVGGITLTGGYQVVTVLDSDNFTINPAVDAVVSESVSENDGVFLVNEQSSTNPPIDRVLYPISRNDYSALPNKFFQSPPTVFWFDRQITPQITLWQVPDQNGPYELRYYRMLQIQDMNLPSGETADMPYRFLEAFVSALAAHLAIKYKPEAAVALDAYSKECWTEAMEEDREEVSTYVVPDMTGYWS